MDQETQVRRKEFGAYYTPDYVVRSLVRWATRSATDRMLDPACGDGRFLAAHKNSYGVDQDPDVQTVIRARAPAAEFHHGDFFEWAARTNERFECAAGNPPFIRYQRFCGVVRKTALALCSRNGVVFSSLTSSWAPFLAATATLLKRGGRMSFVVPSEIGHKPYAAPLLEFLAKRFEKVLIVAIQRKVFPNLSEDCWLLHAEGYGGSTNHFLLSPMTSFGFMPSVPPLTMRIGVEDWRRWNSRLRPFLAGTEVREVYEYAANSTDVVRLGDVARVGIGYVTGGNDFFHLRPTETKRLGIPERFLHATVRNGKALRGRAVTPATVSAWVRRDDPVLLLRICANDKLPESVRRYLDSPGGQRVRTGYKCRNRKPWYVVPDVTTPDAFLSYMCGDAPQLVANRAECACTNSVHAVRLADGIGISELQRAWNGCLTKLSCEVEGHPLGGGLLKIEPREAGRILLSRKPIKSRKVKNVIADGIHTMRRWRHYG